MLYRLSAKHLDLLQYWAMALDLWSVNTTIGFPRPKTPTCFDGDRIYFASIDGTDGQTAPNDIVRHYITNRIYHAAYCLPTAMKIPSRITNSNHIFMMFAIWMSIWRNRPGRFGILYIVYSTTCCEHFIFLLLLLWRRRYLLLVNLFYFNFSVSLCLGRSEKNRNGVNERIIVFLRSCRHGSWWRSRAHTPTKPYSCVNIRWHIPNVDAVFLLLFAFNVTWGCIALIR